MKKSVWGLAAAATLTASLLASSCGQRPKSLLISGTIILAPQIAPLTRRANFTLFVIAKDPGGVPIAIKRFVEPRFPLSFILSPDDLLVPELKLSSPLSVEVEMDARGKAGPPAPGDLFGAYPRPVPPRKKRVDIIIDQRL